MSVAGSSRRASLSVPERDSQRLLGADPIHPVGSLLTRISLHELLHNGRPRVLVLFLLLFELLSLGLFATTALGALTVPIHDPVSPPPSCENNMQNGTVQQPSTAMTSWSYVCIGLLVWTCGISDLLKIKKKATDRGYVVTAMSAELKEQPEHFVGVEPEYLSDIPPSLLQRHVIWSFLFGSAFIFQGCWGFWYHAWPTVANYEMDIFAWIIDASCFTSYLAARALSDGISAQLNPCHEMVGFRIHCSTKGRENMSKFASFLCILCLAVFLISMGESVALQNLNSESFCLAVFGMLGLLQVVFIAWHDIGKNIYVDTRWSFSVYGVGFFIVGIIFFHYDLLMCYPTDYFQAMGVFQVCTAIGLFCFYLTLRSDAYIYDYVLAREKRPTTAPRTEVYRVPALSAKVMDRSSNNNAGDQDSAFVVDLTAVAADEENPQRNSKSPHSSLQPRSSIGSNGGRLSGSVATPSNRSLPRPTNEQPRIPSQNSQRLSLGSNSTTPIIQARRDSPNIKDASPNNSVTRPRQRSLERNIFEVNTNNSPPADKRLSQVIATATATDPLAPRPRPKSLERTIFSGKDPTVSEREKRLSQTSGSKTRKLEQRPVDIESDSFQLPSRELDGLGSVISDQSHRSRLSQHSHQSGGSRHSAGHYWACPNCAFADNELLWVSCERCGFERPPLSQFVKV